jgi:predicted permease
VFTAAVILTLTLGVGAVAAMFAIVYGVLLAPLPYGNPDRLISVNLQANDVQRMQQPPAVYFTYRRTARSLSDLGFYRTGNANIWTEGGGDAPERVTATWVTASTIPLLQVKPLLGRTFAPDEERAAGPNVAVLSESVWRTRFNGARDVLGKTLIVNSVPRQIIGVMPNGFVFPAADTRLWLPARIDPSSSTIGDFSYSGVARLAPGATPSQVQRELTRVLPQVAESFPRLESGMATSEWLAGVRPAPVVASLRDEVTREIARTLWMLGAAAALVLLVAWANVSNLMLIRADGRQLELSVREALGASRLRIVTHFLGESVVLSAVSAGIATLAAWLAVRALVALGPTDVPRLSELRFGLTTLVFVVVVAATGAIICAAVPAIRIRRGNLSISLRDGGRSGTAGKTRQRVRASIAALQIAVALVVAAGSALLLGTLHRLYQERPGFDATNVMTVWTQLPFARYDDSASVAFYGRFVESVRQLPGVRGAGLTMRLPLGAGESREQSFRVEGSERAVSVPANVVDDGYFTTMKVPVVAGRGFQRLGVQRDNDIILSQRAAKTIFGEANGASAVGRRLTLLPSGPAYTVVGVVGDIRDRDLATAPASMVYLPQAVPTAFGAQPSARRTLALVVRTSGSPGAAVSGVRQIVHDIDPTVPIFNVASMDEVIRASTARLSLTLVIMTAAAAITLLLGAIGLYGVMAYMVALRTREFGVRVALGANPRHIAKAVASRGLRLTAAGIGTGFVLYAIAAPFLRSFLYGVSATDPVTLGVVTLALVAVGSIASWLPARRAARVDPAEALRAD